MVVLIRLSLIQLNHDTYRESLTVGEITISPTPSFYKSTALGNPFFPAPFWVIYREVKKKKKKKKKKMKNTGKSWKGNGKSSEVRKDRKSGTGLNGSPKKGGHGGKFTWAGDGYSRAEMGLEKEALDAKDPNFEDPEVEDDKPAVRSS